MMDRATEEYIAYASPDSQRIKASRVWVLGNTVYKSQPKYLTDNEFYFLTAMEDTGYVPLRVRREGIELISMEYVVQTPVTDGTEFLSHYVPVLTALRNKGIKHGDLTTYSVLARNNRPVLIDFAESRWIGDPIPTKRRESDAYWLRRTMKELCTKQQGCQ